MANQTDSPDLSDVADNRGHFGPDVLPGEPEWDPDDSPDCVVTHGWSDADDPDRPLEGLADPRVDGNSPDPDRPIIMAARPVPGHEEPSNREDSQP
jgi:hypothetical protein